MHTNHTNQPKKPGLIDQKEMSNAKDEKPRRHMAVCAFPFGTHAAPLLLLVKRMAAAAPDVRFSFFNVERSNTSVFKAIDVSGFPNIVPCNIKMPAGQGPGGNPIKAIELFIEHAPESFRRAMDEAEAEVGVTISGVIADAFLWFCCEIAEQKNSVWIALWTAGSVALSAHFHTDLIRSKFGAIQGIEEREDELGDCVSGFLNIRICDLPMGVVGDLSSPFSQMLHKTGSMLPKADAVVLNGFEELSPNVTHDLKSKMKFLCIGPFPLTSPPPVSTDEFNCLAWLDKQEAKSVAYISFGTVATPPPHEIKALAEALEFSGVPFLWSMNDLNKVHLPSSFMERINKDERLGKIVPWAPQLKLLARPSIGVFITHCGWNSVIESIVTGVPVICRPMLGDQTLNQRLIECDWKFGIGIEGRAFTKSETIHALKEVLSSEKGHKMRRNLQDLKELAQESVKPGGSSVSNFDTLTKLVKS